MYIIYIYIYIYTYIHIYIYIYWPAFMIVEQVVLYIFASFYTTVTPPTFTTGLNWDSWKNSYSNSLLVASVLTGSQLTTSSEPSTVLNSLPEASVRKVPNSLPVAKVPNSLRVACMLRVLNSLPAVSMLLILLNFALPKLRLLQGHVKSLFVLPCPLLILPSFALPKLRLLQGHVKSLFVLPCCFQRQFAMLWP